MIETQPGNVNWTPVNSSLDKGEGRAMAWQAIAHGADGVAYWQRRSAYGGQEQYHGSLIDQSGRTRPFYEEAKQIGQEFIDLHRGAGSQDVNRGAVLLRIADHERDNGCFGISGRDPEGGKA